MVIYYDDSKNWVKAVNALSSFGHGLGQARRDQDARDALSWRKKLEEQDREAERQRREAEARMRGEGLSMMRSQLPPQQPGLVGPRTPEQQQVERMHSYLSALERDAPNMSQGAYQNALGLLSQESAQMQEQAARANIARRLALMERPFSTPGGQELAGFDPTDREQGAILATLHELLAAGAPLDQLHEALAKLEGERINDLHRITRHEAGGERLANAIATAQALGADWGDIAKANVLLQEYLHDDMSDYDAYRDLIQDALMAGDRRHREAVEMASKAADGAIPTASDVNAAARTLYPRSEQPWRGSPRLFPGDSRPPTPGAAAPAPAPAAPSGGGPEASSAVQKAMEHLSKGETQEAADLLKGAGVNMQAPGIMNILAQARPPKPEKPAKKLSETFHGSPMIAGAESALSGALGGSLKAKPRGPAAPEPSEEKLAQERRRYEREKDARGERAREARMRTQVKRTWARLTPQEQEQAKAALKEAISKARRFDFYGALAPTLRALGIDLGSLPKGVSRELREALKSARAANKKTKPS